MEMILGAAQSLVNFLFWSLYWVQQDYRGGYPPNTVNGMREFPWNKAGIILAIEVLAWIAFNIFWSWVTHNWWIAIVLVVIIVLVLKKRRRE